MFLGHVGECFELDRRKSAERNLYALHTGRVPHCVRAFGQTGLRVLQVLRLETVEALAVVITLAVRAAAQARLGEELLVDLAEFAQFDLRVVNVDFPTPIGRNLACEFFLPRHTAECVAASRMRNKKIGNVGSVW